jgi:hypothetical protein
MFGNPNISNTPADDNLYRTQADTYGNSYTNPLNSANQNPGWGIDPSLLTPGHQANYRPQAGGPDAYPGGQRPGFFKSLANLNPMRQDPTWGNPYMHSQPSVDAIASRPMDAAMWGMSRVVAPAAMYWGAGKAMGGLNMVGMARGAMSSGYKLGSGIGTGIGRGFGMNATLARGLGMPLGAATGLAAGFALPYAAMQTGMWGYERGISNPYINTRRTADEMRENFSGVSFGNSSGHPVHGGGLGGLESSRIAGKITQQGINDMTFSTGQYTDLAGMTARSGLQDNVTNTSGISKRVKDSADQVKLIMGIAAMPEIRQAMEALSKLQMSGASVTGGFQSVAAKSMMQIGGSAAVAGVSVQHLMSRAGAQGEYLYQANGMTGYMGQIAAARSFASFSAGNRMGLISASTLSRMGGVEGATQSSITGQVNVSQSLFNKMGNYNAYMGKGERGNSAIDTISKFSQSMSANPAQTMAELKRYGRQMGAKQIADQGSLSAQTTIQKIAEAAGLSQRGEKVSSDVAHMILTDVIGISSDDAEGILKNVQMESSPEAHSKTRKDLRTNLVKTHDQYIANQNLYGGLAGVVYSTKKFGNKLADGMSQLIGRPLSNAVGFGSDLVGSAVRSVTLGGTTQYDNRTPEQIDKYFGHDKLKKHDVKAMAGMKVFANDNKEFLIGGSFTDIMGNKFSNYDSHIKVAETLKNLAFKGDARAIKYFDSTTNAAEKSAILSKLISSEVFGAEKLELYSDATIRLELDNYLNTRQLVSASETKEYKKAATSNEELFAAQINALPKVNKGRNDELGKLAKITGLTELGDMQSSIALSARVANMDPNDTDAMSKSRDLAEFSALYKETNPLASIVRAQKVITSAHQAQLYNQAGMSYANDNKWFNEADKDQADKMLASGKIDKRKYDEMKLADSYKNAGGRRVGGNTNAENQTYKEVAGGVQISQEFIKGNARNDMLLKNSLIDFSQHQATVLSLENSESSRTFKTAVKEFASAVKSIKGGKEDPVDPYRTTWGFKGDNGNTKTSNDAAGNK